MKSKGFTLIELVVTLLVLTMVTSVALRSASGLQDQARFEQTRERLQMIREAILGDPRKTVNGQAVMSGFVADMGRLPNNLHELLEREYCMDDITKSNAVACGTSWVSLPPYNTYFCTVSGYYTSTECTTAGGYWNINPGNLGVGWRGPYIQTSQNPKHNDAFTDGWGREGVDDPLTLAVDERHFYGWDFFDLSNLTGKNTDQLNLIVQSFGANFQRDNVIPTSQSYTNDFPFNQVSLNSTTYYPDPLVKRGDWVADLSSGIGVNIMKRPEYAGYCGFSTTQAGTLSTQQSCENAAGGWSGTACAMNVSNCKSVGGQWQSCFFAPTACTIAGGVARAQCHFSKKSCNAAGGPGSWNASNTCSVNSVQTNCTNAGGSWNDPSCDFTEGSCALAGGAWLFDCSFSANPTNCANAGGVWDSTTNPNSCAFTPTACAAANGQANGSDCYMSHAESTGARYTPSGCQAVGGAWTATATARVCMNIFYRNPDTPTTILRAWSGPVNISVTGGNESVSFSNFLSQNSNPIGSVPMGSVAVGIYQWDGNNCDPALPLYAADHALLQVDLQPRSSVPVLNW